VTRGVGLQDFVGVGRTIGATLHVTIRLIIVHLFKTCGLGGSTRQCLRETSNKKEGHPTLSLLWKVRNDFVKES